MVDVSNMSYAKVEEVVKEAVKQATDPIDAIQTLRQKFPLAKIVWVKSIRNFQWQVQIQPYPDGDTYDFKCDRRP